MLDAVKLYDHDGNPIDVLDVRLSGNEAIDIGDITLLSGEAHVGEVGGKLISVAVAFARPADTNAYIAGDIVSTSVTTTVFMAFAALARVAAGSGYIVRAALGTNKKSITPRFRVHLFNGVNSGLSIPVVGDNVPYKEVYADAAFRLGYFDLSAMTTAVDATNSDLSRTMDNALLGCWCKRSHSARLPRRWDWLTKRYAVMQAASTVNLVCEDGVN